MNGWVTGAFAVGASLFAAVFLMLLLQPH